MAGEVRTECMSIPGSSVRHIVASTCPVTQRYGQVCLAFDPHVGSLALCPFWYGMRIESGTWHLGEVRCIQEAREWMATDDPSVHRRYTVRCLRAESKGIEPGARLRP